MVATVNEIFLEDIESQPAMLVSTLPDLRRQAAGLGPPGGRVVLTGSGDSWIASLAVERSFRSYLDAAVRALPALEASRCEVHAGATVVIVSVSGGVSRAIEIAIRAREKARTVVAVTANPESELAGQCDRVIVIAPPINRAIPHARDFTATLAALVVVLEAFTGQRFQELDVWSESVRGLLDRSWEWANGLTSSDRLVWFLGAGSGRAAAMYGALKYWEAGGMEAWWDDLEEFAHGSQLMARLEQRAFLIASAAVADRAAEMLPAFEQMGMDAQMITDVPDPAAGIVLPHLGGDEWFPLLCCFPLQALTYVDATTRGGDVMVPLGGRPFGQTFLDVHTEWTKHSALNEGVAGPRGDG